MEVDLSIVFNIQNDDIINPGNIVLPSKILRLPPIFNEYDCRFPTTNVLLVKNDIVVRTTTEKDWTYINNLSKNNSWAVGFLPRKTWTEYVWGGERNFVCYLLEVNKHPAGYILITPGYKNKPIRIQQIVVQEDLRRWEYGSALVEVAENFRKKFYRSGIKLRCRDDLEANLFWTFLGFSLLDVQKEGTTNHMGFKASLDINIFERENDWKYNFDINLDKLLLLMKSFIVNNGKAEYKQEVLFEINK